MNCLKIVDLEALKCVLQEDCKLNKRIIKNNIKNTLFFSYSVIFSTLFCLTYLGIKNTYWDIERDIQNLKYSKSKHSNNIKSLERKKNLLIRSVEDIALKDIGFTTPDPQPFMIIMDENE